MIESAQCDPVVVDSTPNSSIVRKPEMKLVSAGQLIDTYFPPAIDLVEGRIRKQSLVFLAGDTGCGKSILSMNLAVSIADNREHFLGYNLAGHGEVIYVNAELALPDFRLRLDKMTESGKWLEGRRRLMITESLADPDQFWGILEQLAKERKPSLIIIDPLIYIHDKDEQDNSAMKDIVRRSNKLRDNFDTCVFIVHHNRKAGVNERKGTDQMRGAGVLGHAADAVFSLGRSTRDVTLRVFSATKLRHDSDDNLRPRILMLDGRTLWFSNVGEANEADIQQTTTLDKDRRPAIIEALRGQETATPTDIYESVKSLHPTISARTIGRDLERMVATEAIVRKGHGKYALSSTAMVASSPPLTN